eukprot:SAG22_NODE_281_length_13064_cov_13.367605_11_plen_85_part_01
MALARATNTPNTNQSHQQHTKLTHIHMAAECCICGEARPGVTCAGDDPHHTCSACFSDYVRAECAKSGDNLLARGGKIQCPMHAN